MTGHKIISLQYLNKDHLKKKQHSSKIAMYPSGKNTFLLIKKKSRILLDSSK